MNEIKALADDLYREQVLRARRMTVESKFCAGQELFEYACSLNEAGIRLQFPDLDDQGVRPLLEREAEVVDVSRQEVRAVVRGRPCDHCGVSEQCFRIEIRSTGYTGEVPGDCRSSATRSSTATTSH